VAGGVACGAGALLLLRAGIWGGLAEDAAHGLERAPHLPLLHGSFLHARGEGNEDAAR
jgi:hypothetical protein